MKRKIVSILMIIAAVISLAACGSKETTFECDMCFKTVTGEKHIVKNSGYAGNATFCDDCYEKYLKFKEEAKDIFN